MDGGERRMLVENVADRSKQYCKRETRASLRGRGNRIADTSGQSAVPAAQKDNDRTSQDRYRGVEALGHGEFLQDAPVHPSERVSAPFVAKQWGNDGAA